MGRVTPEEAYEVTKARERAKEDAKWEREHRNDPPPPPPFWQSKTAFMGCGGLLLLVTVGVCGACFILPAITEAARRAKEAAANKQASQPEPPPIVYKESPRPAPKPVEPLPKPKPPIAPVTPPTVAKPEEKKPPEVVEPKKPYIAPKMVRGKPIPVACGKLQKYVEQYEGLEANTPGSGQEMIDQGDITLVAVNTPVAVEGPPQNGFVYARPTEGPAKGKLLIFRAIYLVR